MRDPLEGLSATGVIRTGADIRRVPEGFRAVHEAAAAMIRDSDAGASVYAYGSAVTGQARIGVSDVDLLTIGLNPSDAKQIGAELSTRFAETCRGVEIGAGQGGDFLGESDEAYGNRVFLRHYGVLLAGPDTHRPEQDFAGDSRAARGFNGDVAHHARRWRHALDSGDEAPGTVARRMARKSLLAVAGLVSVSDHTWTTDRESAAHRWAEIAPQQRAGLVELLSWTSTPPESSVESVSNALDRTVAGIVDAFSELIGLWPDLPVEAHRTM